MVLNKLYACRHYCSKFSSHTEIQSRYYYNMDSLPWIGLPYIGCQAFQEHASIGGYIFRFFVNIVLRISLINIRNSSVRGIRREGWIKVLGINFIFIGLNSRKCYRSHALNASIFPFDFCLFFLHGIITWWSSRCAIQLRFLGSLGGLVSRWHDPFASVVDDERSRGERDGSVVSSSGG